MISTITVSKISGRRLNNIILITEANDYDPLETILIILPVYLLKWKAKHYL